VSGVVTSVCVESTVRSANNAISPSGGRRLHVAPDEATARARGDGRDLRDRRTWRELMPR